MQKEKDLGNIVRTFHGGYADDFEFMNLNDDRTWHGGYADDFEFINLADLDADNLLDNEEPITSYKDALKAGDKYKKLVKEHEIHLLNNKHDEEKNKGWSDKKFTLRKL